MALVASAAYGVTILSVAGSNGSQTGGGVLTNATLSNIYADFATLNTALGGSGIVSVTAGKTFAVTNSLTLSGTDATTMTFPTTSATIARTDAANTFTGVQTMTSPALTTAVLTTDAHCATAGGCTLGTALLPASSAFIGGAATNNFNVTGTATAARTVTLPDASITVSGATSTDCGAAAGACAGTATSTILKIVRGTAPATSASPSTVAITGMPAFTSTATYSCFAEDATTVGNVFAVLTAGYVSTTAVTFTGPNTLTDVIRWTCIGY